MTLVGQISFGKQIELGPVQSCSDIPFPFSPLAKPVPSAIMGSLGKEKHPIDPV
jgi:hypothetical protein